MFLYRDLTGVFRRSSKSNVSVAFQETLSTGSQSTILHKGTLEVASRGKLEQLAPLRVVPFIKLKALGHLPRSTQCGATLASGRICGADHWDLLEIAGPDWDFSIAGKPIVMISHSWILPSEGKPDNVENRKYSIVVAGVEELCKRHGIAEKCIHIFFDWVSIPQETLNDGTDWFMRYVWSLPAFVAQMAFVLVPLDASLLMSDKYRLDADGDQVQMNWAHYSVRGWCRAEMFVGRVLAACGTGVRVYRCNGSWPGPPILTEVPPYTGASQCLLPTGADAFYTCCQRDHYIPGSKIPSPCDKESVKHIESILASTVKHHQGVRRKHILEQFPFDECTAVSGLPAIEASVFLKWGSIPRSRDGLARHYSDDELSNKVVFYFSEQYWHRGDWFIFKHRWMSSVLETLIAREELELQECLVFLAVSCGWCESIGSDVNKNMVPVLARVTYFILFNQGIDGSPDALTRAMIRLELFVPRALAEVGVYTAIYESTLGNVESLADMTLKLLDTKRISSLCNFKDYDGAQDPLCPWYGSARRGEMMEQIKARTNEILLAVASMGKTDVVDFRQQLVERAAEAIGFTSI